MSKELEEIIRKIINGTKLRHCRNSNCKLHSSAQGGSFCLLREIYLNEEGKCQKIIKK